MKLNKVAETLQMYRYSTTVQLGTLQMDDLLQRNINSEIREATRECMSKWRLGCGVPSTGFFLTPENDQSSGC